MADQEKTVGAIEALEKTVLKSLEDHSGSIKELDAQLQEKVTELRKSIDEAKADGGKLSEKSAESLKAMSSRLEDFERRYGRANGPDGKREPEMTTEKSFGGQVAEWIADPNIRERASNGRGTARLALKGASLRQHVIATELLKSRNLVPTDENIRKAMLLSDVTNFAPVNRFPDVLPIHARRRAVQDLIPTRSLAIGSAWEYLQYEGVAPSTYLTATSIASTGYVATLTYTAHGCLPGDRIHVKDSTDTEYNGYFTVLTVPTADTLTYKMAADAVDDTADGTILWANLSKFGAAASVAENNAKPESIVPARTVTGVVELIAHIFRLTKQALDDVPSLSTQINANGIAGLQSLLEYKLLYGAGTSNTILGLLAAGSQTQAYTQANTGSVGRFSMFRHGVTLIEGAGGMPTGAVMNHADWETFELSVGLDDHWMLPGGANGNAPSLWRVPVVSTRWIAPGTILMGDFQSGAELVEREGPQVSFADQDGDDFTYNRVAMRFEQRVGLAVPRPEMFVALTLTS